MRQSVRPMAAALLMAAGVPPAHAAVSDPALPAGVVPAVMATLGLSLAMGAL